MKDIQITINPPEIRSVNYVNNFSVPSGEKINLKAGYQLSVRLNPTNPVAAAVLIKYTVTDEQSNCINMEIETITGVTVNTFVDNLDQYIRDNFINTIVVANNEKLRTLSMLLGSPIRLPNPTF